MSDANVGYSGKPLSQKLGLKPGLRLRLLHAPDDYAALTGFDLTQVVVLGRTAGFDFGHAFVRSHAQLIDALDRLDPHLAANGQLWISWPKQAAKLATDINENSVREAALARGLVDVKVCAVDALWSGLKLVRRKALR